MNLWSVQAQRVIAGGKQTVEEFVLFEPESSDEEVMVIDPDEWQDMMQRDEEDEDADADGDLDGDDDVAVI